MNPTEFHPALLDAAGLIMRVLHTLPTPADGQVALAFVCAYLCNAEEIPLDVLLYTLRHNITQTSIDSALMNRVVERVHRISTEPNLSNAMNVAGNESSPMLRLVN